MKGFSFFIFWTFLSLGAIYSLTASGDSYPENSSGNNLYANNSASVSIPYANAADVQNSADYVSPQILVSFNTPNANGVVPGWFPVTMDTGSTGMIIGTRHFPVCASNPAACPSAMTMTATTCPAGKACPTTTTVTGTTATSTTTAITTATGAGTTTTTVTCPTGTACPAGMTCLGPGSQSYSSSHVTLSGCWYGTSVSLLNPATHHQLAVSQLPVLVVTSCPQTTNNVTQSCGASDTTYMGVGFDPGSTDKTDTPEKNAFLNVTQIPGNTGGMPSPGYILTTSGVTIGLTSSNASGFAMIKLWPITSSTNATWLTPPANPAVNTDWRHAVGSLSVNNATAVNASILFDTGVQTAFLTQPSSVQIAGTNTAPNYTAAGFTNPPTVECGGTSRQCAPAGTNINVSFNDSNNNAIASFQYTVTSANGYQNGAQPNNPVSAAAVALDKGAPFFNTSARFLQAFSYLYDNANGFIGLSMNSAYSIGSGGQQYVSSNSVGASYSIFGCIFSYIGNTKNGIITSPVSGGTQYAQPFTYRYYSNNNPPVTYRHYSSNNPPVFIGVSSGGNYNSLATVANEVYDIRLGVDPQSLDNGTLDQWLSNAACH